jgi:23S rRNA pseudouridine1911/1915/1917 synthase
MKAIQHAGAFKKTYLAIVCGVPKEPRFVIDAPIGFAEGLQYKHTVRPDGAAASSECEILRTFDDISLVRLTPHTGRTHQLRVHMAYAGFPLLGDWLYGERSGRIDRPALHAAALQFTHPITGRRFRCPHRCRRIWNGCLCEREDAVFPGRGSHPPPEGKDRRDSIPAAFRDTARRF